MNPEHLAAIQSFERERKQRTSSYADDQAWKKLSLEWLTSAFEKKYMYNYSWMGVPVIQNPNDLMVMQELIWAIKPEIIIETGIAHGGSLIFYASMLDLIGAGQVIGVDIDIRAHNREVIEAHPMSERIQMLEGSSIDPLIIEQVKAFSHGKRTMVVLDSNHTHDHVLAELKAYAPLTSTGSYCVVFDTIVEDLPDSMFPDRPWAQGNNPKTAVWQYLGELKDSGRAAEDGLPLNFEIDKTIECKLMITVAPDGYLKRIP
ncbi:MAG: cephalosporin hydroxylase family protein [Arenimonas sp.]